MITGGLKLYPYRVGIFSGHMSYFFPFVLDPFQFLGTTIPFLAILKGNGKFQEGPFFVQIYLLIFFKVLIVGVFVPVEFPYRFLETGPSFFVFLLRYFPGLKKLVP